MIKYYNYKGLRTFYKDGYWWGMMEARGLRLKEKVRLDKYPEFIYFKNLSEFDKGWSDGYRYTSISRDRVDPGRRLWPDYWTVHQWLTNRSRINQRDLSGIEGIN